jgi:putative redox protein
MVEIDAVYSGNKKCTLTHPEGATLQTDAPKDIGGDATAFSPTDLVASGLATCILTTIGMFAERRGIDITGATAHVGKEMSQTPRRIGRLPVVITLPASIPDDLRPAFEKVGRSCPVHASLHPDIDAPIDYQYQ